MLEVESMDSRERILIALSHREPDRVPYDLGALGPSGISIQAYRNLLKYLHADLPRFPWPDPLDPNRLAGVENEVLAVRKQANPAFVLGSPFSSGLLQFGAQLEGHERFFTDLVLDPPANGMASGQTPPAETQLLPECLRPHGGMDRHRW